MTRRAFITLLGGAVSLFLCVSAAAQEGYYGVGHDKWHQGFYSTLKRNDGGGSCCNLMDCSVSFYLWRADGSTGRVANAERRKSHIKSGAKRHAQHCTG